MRRAAHLPTPSCRVAALALAAAVLAGCGGGGGAAVTAMSASPTQYGRNAVWTASGAGLETAVFRIVSGACPDPVEVGLPNPTLRQWSCRMASVGTVKASVETADGKRLGELAVAVPAPVVRLKVDQTISGTVTQHVIDVELDPVRTPATVDNFLDYVDAGFYSGTIFHRVIDDFVIQAGGFVDATPVPVAKPATRPPIELETNRGLSNVRGTIAMARTPVPDSATSQFYINVVDNPSLDYRSDAEPGYAVFGRITDRFSPGGLVAVDAIAAAPTQNLGGAFQNLPVTPIVITSAFRLR